MPHKTSRQRIDEMDDRARADGVVLSQFDLSGSPKDVEVALDEIADLMTKIESGTTRKIDF